MNRVLRLIATMGMIYGIAFAAPVACVPGTLADYVNLGSDGCMIGNARVFEFVDLGPLGGATGLTADMVDVTPFGGASNPGLQFAFALSAGPGELLESRFAYVLETASPVIAAGLLTMTGSSVDPDGVNTVVEDFCHGEGFVVDFCLAETDTLIVFDIGLDAEFSARLDLPGLTRVGLMKDVVVDGGLAGSASLETATNEFVLVPEPMTGPTLLLGLFACAVLRALRRPARGGAR